MHKDLSMTEQTTAPYGSWRSPITASSLTARSVRLGEPLLDGEYTYWLESRPEERGRSALVKQGPDGERRDRLPAPHSVRTRAHEYGGGAYTVGDGWVYAVLDADQRIYRLAPDSDSPEPVSPEGPWRYADLHLDSQRRRLICVREDHSDPDREERAEIVALPLDRDPAEIEVEILVTGADFYSNPRLSPDGTQLSWLCWNHPRMPWEGTECHLAQLDDAGRIVRSRRVAGGPEESVFQPAWSPDGRLYFVSDRSGWWNLYRHDGNTCEALCPLDAEFATPQWVFGMSTYGFLDAGTILCCLSQDGCWQLARLHLQPRRLELLDTGLSSLSDILCGSGRGQPRGLLIGAGATQGSALWQYRDGDPLLCLARSTEQAPPPAYLSRPEAISFTSGDGEAAHGFFYPPVNPDFRAPEGELPPLLVTCHGGPTGATDTALNLKIQFWTSRGFAVLDVNYRGSTGYGRAYRERLKGQWGLVDVADVCAGAETLVAQGRVDPRRLAIRGSSAGGYTVLAALTFSQCFAAGTSLYGIGDLEALTRDTHKFESRYLDSLVGPYPEQQDLYRQRSPIHHIDQLNCPVLFLQGLQDNIVPPNQAEAMAAALDAKGIANALVTFEEEGHGFRQAANIQRALEAELYFYSRIFRFDLPEPVTPLNIAHLREREQTP